MTVPIGQASMNQGWPRLHSLDLPIAASWSASVRVGSVDVSARLQYGRC